MMNATKAHQLARDMFARLILDARSRVPPGPDGEPTMQAYEGIEIEFFAAMANLNAEMNKAKAMAAALREFAARHDALSLAILSVTGWDDITVGAAIVEYNDAAGVLAEIGRDIERHESRARDGGRDGA